MMRILLHKAERIAALFLGVMLGCAVQAGASSPAPGTAIPNTAAAQYRDVNGNSFSTLSNTVYAVLSGGPKLDISAGVLPNPVAPGGTFTFTAVIENSGNAAAEGIAAVANLPSGINISGATADGIPLPAGPGWDLGDIAPGSSVTLRITASVDPGIPDGSELPLSITVSGSGMADVPAAVTVRVGLAPHLVLIDTASVARVTPGGLIEYTIHYENRGNAPSADTVIRNGIPSLTALVPGSITGGGLPDNGTITWNSGTLEPGGSGSVRFTALVSATAKDGDLIRNVSVMTGGGTGPVSSNELLVPVTGHPSLIFVKSGPGGQVAPGARVDYSLAVINDGDIRVSGITVEDPLPAGLTFVDSDTAHTLDGATVRWNLGAMEPGEMKTIRLTASVDAWGTAGRTLANTATVTSAETGLQASSSTLSVGTGALSLGGGAVTGTARPGNETAFSITLRNEGQVPLLGVVIRHPLAGGTVFSSADSGGTEDGGTVLWTFSSLDPGGEITVHLVVTLDKTYAQDSVAASFYVSALGIQETAFTATKAVTARTPGTVGFYTADWKPSLGYEGGDTIYIEARDDDQNLDPAVLEHVTVVLTNPQDQNAARRAQVRSDSKAGDNPDSETLVLAETGTDTGIFRGSVPSTFDITGQEDGRMTVVARSRLNVTYTDTLDAAPVHDASALVDPGGVVYDSVTGAPVPGALVILRNWDSATDSLDLSGWPELQPGQENPGLVTGEDGRFTVPLAVPGEYGFQVIPPSGYSFPSVVPDRDLPPGHAAGDGARGGKFTMNAGDAAPITDIPLDPPQGRLKITKTADRAAASIGDLVTYALKVENGGDSPVAGITVSDLMPRGLSYVKGSTFMDGRAAPDPTSSAPRSFVWTGPALDGGGSFVLTYRAVVGPDARPGEAVNRASCTGTSVGRAVASNTGSVKITVTQGVFTTKGTVIGRVFVDRNGNGRSDSGEGTAGAALYLEDGTRVITDEKGKFSISGIEPGTHVLRLDETSLPTGLEPVPASGRFMGDGASQFVDMTPGGLFKANFMLKEKKEEKEKPPGTVVPGEMIEAPGRGDEAVGFSVPSAEGTVSSGHEIPPVSGGPVSGIIPGEVVSNDGGKAREGHESEVKPPAVGEPAKDSLPKGDTEPPLSERILTMTADLDILKPADRSVISRNSTRVLVKAPSGAIPTLTVNGVKVGDRLIGTKIENGENHVALYEYIGVDLAGGGSNLIRAEIRDSSGSLLGSKQITVDTLGKPSRVVVAPDIGDAEADGLSRIGVKVAVTDAAGRPVPVFDTVTVSVSAGDIVEKDADPAAPGLQIPCRGGEARFTLVSPRQTGQALISVETGDLSGSAPVYFLPNQRNMFIVGLGEVVFGRGRSSGDASVLNNRMGYGDGTYLEGKGAFFMKGTLYKDIVVTSAYDSDKKRTDELFRQEGDRFDTGDTYPVYGDGSVTGHEAVSREKLYLKVEKGKNNLLFGDYRTDLTESKLGTYTRSFNGVKMEGNTGNAKLKAFGAYTDQSRYVDTLPGKGISGLYYLTRRQIIEGSERVTVETRDRIQPDRVVTREAKVRGSDYDIDYDLGTLLFKSSVPGHDGEGNPVYIVASYESQGDGEKHMIYGGRGSYDFSGRLNVGVTGIVEENAVRNNEITGLDAVLKLPLNTVVKGEYAETRGLFDIDNALVSKTANGWSLELESRPSENMSMETYYRELSDYFSNPSAPDAVRGTRKWGLDAVYKPFADVEVRTKYLDEEDQVNGSSHRLASVAGTKKFDKTSLNAEISHETSDNLTDTPAQIPFTPGGLLNGVPFLNAYETPEKATSLKLGVERELPAGITFSLSHKQDIEGDGVRLSQGGLTWKINETNRIYLREEYAKNMDDTQIRTLFGSESQLTRSTTAYQEYRVADGSAGARTQEVIGLKNRFLISEGLTSSLAGEYLKTLKGEKNDNEPDAYAVAAGMEYLPRDDLKLTGRAEHRHETAADGKESYLAEAGMACKVNADYTLLFRERYFLENAGGAGDDRTSRFMAGVAYRPVEADRFNALTRIEYITDRRTGADPSVSTDAYVFSTEGHFQATRRLQLTGKYAGKLAKQESLTAYTDLVAARFLFDLTDRFDVGSEYRLLTSHLTHDVLHGGSVEAGYRVVKQLWISLGYSFDRFDADLAGDSYQGKGGYVKLRFKFDENTFSKHGK